MTYYKITLTVLIFLTACQSQKENITIPALPTLNENNQNIALTKHNQLRQLHFNDSALIYSQKLELDAQKYANKLAENGKFDHDPDNLNSMYGENLHAFSSSKAPNLSEIIQKWYDEKQYYNYNTQECKNGQLCGHYTQIVWKRSKLLGCASAQYQKGRFKNGYVTVCKYYPYGNIVGKDPY